MKLKNLETRRSIKEYSSRDISHEVLEEILTAALYAPTAVNTQAFKMVVVKRNDFDQDTLSKMTKQKHSLSASHNIFIYTLKKEAMKVEWMNEFVFYIPEEKRNEYSQSVIDHFKSNANLEATGHIVAFALALEADAQGVGSTIYTGFDKELTTTNLKDKVSKDYELSIAISLGYKTEGYETRPKKIKPLSEVVIYNK